MEFTIIGDKLAGKCRTYLHEHNLPIDYQGKNQPYDLVVTCSDVYIQKNIRNNRIVLVRRGLRTGKHSCFASSSVSGSFLAGRREPRLRASAMPIVLSASQPRDIAISSSVKDARPEKIIVTGLPNFDNCRRYCTNDFPHRHYVLVCTSPLREILQGEDREAFLRKAVEIAGGRQLIFKLHPNENARRAIGEIHRHVPQALVFTTGSAEEMIANCDVLITRFSSTAFVGIARARKPTRTLTWTNCAG